MTVRGSGASGYLLVEALVAVAIVAAATAIAARIVLDARALVETGAARADLHQRTRVATATLNAALGRAGVGMASGPFAGPLVRFLPPILAGRAAPPQTTTFAPHALAIVSTLEARPASLAQPALPRATTLELAYDAGCAPPCGFQEGTSVLLFDAHGDFDVFSVTTSDATALAVRPTGLGTNAAYAAGSAAVPVDLRIYYLDRAARELRLWRAARNDFPVIDHVVDLAFEYFGDPRPPVSPVPMAAGENCLYTSDGLRPREALPANAGRAALPASSLTDGPWCGSGSTPFDADLLRIRAISVSLRLEVAEAALRGSVPGWFRHPGTAIAPATMVRDVSVRFEIHPPNLVSWR